MPTGPTAIARVATLAGLLVAVAIVAVLLLGGGESYRLKILLPNASQLVNGNVVTVGGAEVGTVEKIELTDDNQAQITLELSDDDLTPLHRGTTAAVRNSSLSSVAGRTVALAPGPNNAPEIADGGTISARDTTAAVDLDAVLNSLDAATRQSLQDVVRRSADTYTGVEPAANAGLKELNPALGETRRTIAEVMRDQSAFEHAIVSSAAVVSAVTERDPALLAGIRDAGATAQAVANERGALASLLDRTPDTLRRANTTLVNLRPALAELRPALQEARPVAPRLARTLKTLAPVARRARPVIADTRKAILEVTTAVKGLPSVARYGVPAFASTTKALDGAAPIVAGLRAYTPDLIGGLVFGFGGLAANVYDANGHYGRIGAVVGPYSASGLASLLNIQPAKNSLGGFFKGSTGRCPGSAAAADDGSSPWSPSEAPCTQRSVP